METAARFCKHCGTAFGEDSARFCKKCGASRFEPTHPLPPVGQVAAAASGGASAVPSSGRASAGRTGGIAARVAGGGALAAGLPWQTLVAGKPIDAAIFLRGATPAAARALSRSLRRPGLVLAFTIAMSFAVALLTGGGDSLTAALPQLLTGAAASGFALLTRRGTGRLRAVAGVVSVIAAVVALASLGAGIVGSLNDGDGLVAALPLAVAMASSALAAGKTALVALRRA